MSIDYSSSASQNGLGWSTEGTFRDHLIQSSGPGQGHLSLHQPQLCLAESSNSHRTDVSQGIQAPLPRVSVFPWKSSLCPICTFQVTVSNHCPLLHCLAPLRRVCFQVVENTQSLFTYISSRLPLATFSPSSTSSPSLTILAAFWPFSFSTSLLTWRLQRKS